jgi:hypothetical protein
LSKSDDRIVLWRNGIQLFHKYKNFAGPFKSAGFDKYVVEQPFLTNAGEDISPDIISSGNDGWVIFELTTSPNSKDHNFEKYRKADPRYLNQHGLIVHDTEPDILSGRLESVPDGPVCKLIIKDVLQIENSHCLKNTTLANYLNKAEGTDLSKLPQIPITLVPEMASKSGEIRRGLVDIVMKLFDPSCEGMTLIQIVDEGLERLANVTNVTQKKSLMNKVEYQMNLLIDKNLKDYLEYNDGKYRKTEKFKKHHATMESISLELKKWSESSQSTLDVYR